MMLLPAGEFPPSPSAYVRQRTWYTLFSCLPPSKGLVAVESDAVSPFLCSSREVKELWLDSLLG